MERHGKNQKEIICYYIGKLAVWETFFE